MGDQGIRFFERARVQEEVDSLSGGEFAALVLSLDSLCAAAPAALFSCFIRSRRSGFCSIAMWLVPTFTRPFARLS
jgi:hypothetical protein